MTLFQLKWLLALLGAAFLAGSLFVAGSRARGPFRNRILKWNILFVLGAISLISFFNFHYFEQQYATRSQQIEQELLDQAKQLIKQRATFLQTWILDENTRAEDQLKQQLQQIVHQAIDTAAHLMETYRHSMDSQQLQHLVLEALRPLRFNNGRGYLFATKMDGTSLMCAEHSSFEGKNLKDLGDSDGVYYTQRMIELCQQQGSGFVQFRINKPGTDSWDHKKIAYVEYFKPLDCYIGTGEYWDDFDVELQQQIFDKLNHLTNEHALSIFGASYSGVSLFGPAKGQNMLEVKDKNGLYVVKELISQARRGGGFVQYQMPENLTEHSYPKLSYCLPIKAWNGYIGAGINLRRVDQNIALSKNELKQTIYRQLFQTGLSLPLAILLLWFIGLRFSSAIEKNIKYLKRALNDAFSSQKPINLDKIYYDEFRSVGSDANEMIQQYREAEQTNHWLSLHDPLTKLANRLNAMESLEHIIRQQSDSGQIWLFMLRLERLKHVNDAFGHQAGDHVLQTIAQRLVDMKHQPLLTARIGSSEFLLVLELQSISAEQKAFSLRETLTAGIGYDNFDIKIDFSIGCVPFGNDDVSSLLHKSTATLNMVRDSKNLDKFLVYDEALDLKLQELQKLEADLRRAIDDPQQFILHFQPIWDIKENRLAGFETLTRWLHPVDGMIAPALFIPIAEQKGLIVPLGEIIFETACATMSRWLNQYPQLDDGTLRVSVNMAPQQFITDGFIERTTKTLQRYGIPNNMLTIEITETSLMENPDLAIQRIRSLNELGIKISIDDFGTGYSSLSYLNQFDVNTIKIDRSLVMNIDTNQTVESISAAIINLAHDLNLRVVAEGIETQPQLTKLQQLGCDAIQGYLLGKPMPEDDAEKLLTQRALVWPTTGDHA